MTLFNNVYHVWMVSLKGYLIFLRKSETLDTTFLFGTSVNGANKTDMIFKQKMPCLGSLIDVLATMRLQRKTK